MVEVGGSQWWSTVVVEAKAMMTLTIIIATIGRVWAGSLQW